MHIRGVGAVHSSTLIQRRPFGPYRTCMACADDLVMDAELERLFDDQGGVATSGQILALIPRRTFERELRTGALEQIGMESTAAEKLTITCGCEVWTCRAEARCRYVWALLPRCTVSILKNPRTSMCSTRRVVSCDRAMDWSCIAAPVHRW